MAEDAGYELMVTAMAAMRDGETGAMVTGVYDRVPEDGETIVKSPYISFGPVSSVTEDADCIDAEEVTIQIDVWSYGNGLAYGKAECLRIAAAVKRDLHRKELSLATNALVTMERTLTRVMRDPDGITNHAVIQFSAVIETP